MAKHAIPAAHHGEVDRLNAAWPAQAELPGAGLAVAVDFVRAALHAADVPTVEVVINGQGSPAARSRLTSEVVRQFIGRAPQRFTLVGRATYRRASDIATREAAVA